MSLYELAPGDAAAGLTVEAMHLLDVHHRSSSEERSTSLHVLPLAVTLVCVGAASGDCIVNNHYRCYAAVILGGRKALYDRLPRHHPLHPLLHHCPLQQRYRASAP